MKAIAKIALGVFLGGLMAYGLIQGVRSIKENRAEAARQREEAARASADYQYRQREKAERQKTLLLGLEVDEFYHDALWWTPEKLIKACGKPYKNGLLGEPGFVQGEVTYLDSLKNRIVFDFRGGNLYSVSIQGTAVRGETISEALRSMSCLSNISAHAGGI